MSMRIKPFASCSNYTCYSISDSDQNDTNHASHPTSGSNEDGQNYNESHSDSNRRIWCFALHRACLHCLIRRRFANEFVCKILKYRRWCCVSDTFYYNNINLIDTCLIFVFVIWIQNIIIKCDSSVIFKCLVQLIIFV